VNEEAERSPTFGNKLQSQKDASPDSNSRLSGSPNQRGPRRSKAERRASIMTQEQPTST
jgi:hypothetical protein